MKSVVFDTNIILDIALKRKEYFSKASRLFELIDNLIDVVEIIGIDKNVIVNALNTGIKDFEDAIQVAAAQFNSVDCLITRNKKDFVKSTLTVYTPDEFLEMI